VNNTDVETPNWL